MARPRFRPSFCARSASPEKKPTGTRRWPDSTFEYVPVSDEVRIAPPSAGQHHLRCFTSPAAMVLLARLSLFASSSRGLRRVTSSPVGYLGPVSPGEWQGQRWIGRQTIAANRLPNDDASRSWPTNQTPASNADSKAVCPSHHVLAGGFLQGVCLGGVRLRRLNTCR